jgi:hypothetical protein
MMSRTARRLGDGLAMLRRARSMLGSGWRKEMARNSSARRTSGLAIVAVSIAALAAVVGEVAAQAIGFDPADYGKAQLPARQSTGDAATYIDANKGAFEPVAELDPKDPLAALARPIGRVDVVLRNMRTGQEVGESCTGALLKDDYVLTNHHCLPVDGDLRPVKASILMDYLTLDGKRSRRFEIMPKPEEWSAALDYAITRASDRPSADFGFVRLAAAAPDGSRSLLVIHHPLGRPKVMSRFRCMALKEQENGPDLRHRCDTLGGSSGSLLFDARAEGVALHKEGGLDAKDPSSFNTATRMAAILADSRILKRLAQGDGAPPPDAALSGAGNPKAPAPTAPPAGGLSAGEMNSILRGQ